MLQRLGAVRSRQHGGHQVGGHPGRRLVGDQRLLDERRRRGEALLVQELPEPGLQGDRSTGGTKPATLETGAEIQVPLFITTGEKVKVDTRDSSYLGRVKS